MGRSGLVLHPSHVGRQIRVHFRFYKPWPKDDPPLLPPTEIGGACQSGWNNKVPLPAGELRNDDGDNCDAPSRQVKHGRLQA